MAASTITGYATTLLWTLNLVFFIVTIGRYSLNAEKSMWAAATLFLAFGFLTVFLNADLISGNLKTIGMHINLLVTPLYILFFSNIRNSDAAKLSDAEYLLRILSFLGTITFIIAWILGFWDYIAVLNGNLGAYQANVDGFFNNKNIYGVFISLSLCADIYLAREHGGLGRFVILGLKALAVVLSFSRATLLQFCIAAVLFYLLDSKRSRKGLFLLALIAFCVFAAYISVPSIHEFIDSQLLRLSTGDAGRTQLRIAALAQMPESPSSLLFGVGYAGVSELNIDIDNTYYYEFFSGGIVRLVFMACFLTVPYYLFSSMRAQGCNKSLVNLCLSVHTSYLIYMLFESIAPLELGIINFSFMVYSFVIPCLMSNRVRVKKQKQVSYACQQ